jgi:hypothetical protein
MTIEYKSDIYRLTTTNLTTTLTVNATTRFIVKEISVSNTHNNTVDCNFYLNTVNGSAIFYHVKIPADSHDNAVHNSLVLEENDYLTFQVATAGVISGQISYAVLSRKNQNG